MNPDNRLKEEIRTLFDKGIYYLTITPVGVTLPSGTVVDPEFFKQLRAEILAELPSTPNE